MRPFQLFLLVVIAFSISAAQSAPAVAPKSAGSQRFSIDNIDKTVDPCTDFYQYACGNWLKNTEIPADQSSWVSFIELDERNQFTMRDILDKAAVAAPGRDAITQKIGDFYSSCMDEKATDTKGSDPIKPELERIAAVKDKTTLIDTIAQLHLQGTRGLFTFYSGPDLHNADMVVG
ncbi:MAG TPA: M13 family metallopeptidase N-terminal domain-containing protein, partial [Terriglobia bacterium]|nr:M13 family metallopeptidase N-terminal domain-containing protein [Terriglobia bacterium]